MLQKDRPKKQTEENDKRKWKAIQDKRYICHEEIDSSVRMIALM